VGTETKKAARATADTTGKVVDKTGAAAKDAGHSTAVAADKVGKDTKKVAKKVGQEVEKGAKKVQMH
jgi:hypothetical protein